MKDNLFNLDEYRERKQRELKQKEYEKRQSENEKLFISITTKPTKELTDDEYYAYQEVGVVCTIILKDMYKVALVSFREQLYILNYLGECFEYLGKFEDILSKGLFGEK